MFTAFESESFTVNSFAIRKTLTPSEWVAKVTHRPSMTTSIRRIPMMASTFAQAFKDNVYGDDSVDVFVYVNPSDRTRPQDFAGPDKAIRPTDVISVAAFRKGMPLPDRTPKALGGRYKRSKKSHRSRSAKSRRSRSAKSRRSRSAKSRRSRKSRRQSP